MRITLAERPMDATAIMALRGRKHEFEFGAESHPDDFRCNACDAFAWSGGHEEPRAEDAAWAALRVLTMETPAIGPGMRETMDAWVMHLRAMYDGLTPIGFARQLSAEERSMLDAYSF